ncbi:hypothetical protein ABFV80_001166 [Vandammella animalimorsus]|uniref:hypothetical protein n=1 Tax=Vandammella animalimorsus TaxID=2029117 RepID=UPI00325B1DA9
MKKLTLFLSIITGLSSVSAQEVYSPEINLDSSLEFENSDESEYFADEDFFDEKSSLVPVTQCSNLPPPGPDFMITAAWGLPNCGGVSGAYTASFSRINKYTTMANRVCIINNFSHKEWLVSRALPDAPDCPGGVYYVLYAPFIIAQAGMWGPANQHTCEDSLPIPNNFVVIGSSYTWPCAGKKTLHLRYRK